MNKHGKCVNFPKEREDIYFLVNGKATSNTNQYYYCSTARSIDTMCGSQGKFFEPR